MRIRLKIILLSVIAPCLVGCSHENTIPGSAKIVRNGQGRFGYIAEENGSVYVRDATTKDRIVVAHVTRGDMLFVEPSTNEVQVAGAAVDHKKPLDVSHEYEIYFDRAQ